MELGIGPGGMYISTPLGMGQWVCYLMCNFGALVECREGSRVVSSFLDVEATKYQCCILNPTSLDYITSKFI